MPLDPKAEVFLQRLKVLGAPAIHKMSPDLARKAQATGYAFLAFKIQKVAVGLVQDRTVSTQKRETPVRIYWPTARESGASAPSPLIVFIHGGGWVLGDLDQYDDMCRRLCQGASSIVVSVDYGLAPEWRFPDPVEECYAVTRWAADHAEALGADPNQIAIAGDSAGGNLAAAVCLLARDRDVPRLACQVLMYPVTHMLSETESRSRNGSGYFLESPDMLWFGECYLRDRCDAKDPLASPLLASDHKGLPPAVVITAEYDPLHDEGVAYTAALRKAGVPTVHRDYPGMIHGFMSMTWMFEQAIEAIDFVAETLQITFTYNAQEEARV